MVCIDRLEMFCMIEGALWRIHNHLFGLREAIWTSANLSSPQRVWAALHPELERGVLTQHDFLAAYSSEHLHSSATLPVSYVFHLHVNTSAADQLHYSSRA